MIGNLVVMVGRFLRTLIRTLLPVFDMLVGVVMSIQMKFVRSEISSINEHKPSKFKTILYSKVQQSFVQYK